MGGSWIILGATSPIARAYASLVASEGDTHIILAGRDSVEMEASAMDMRMRDGAADVQVMAFDANDGNSYAALAERAETLPKPVNVFLAFGQMPEQDAMLAHPAVCAQMIAATYTGAVLALNALTPFFERQKGGEIVVLGSVAGDRGRKKNYLYGSAKAGLHAYVQGIAARLSSFGVRVLLVKPGVIDTGMTWGLKNPPLPLGTPEGLALAIRKKSRRGGVLYFPWFWRYIMLVITHLPRFIFNRLNF